MGVDGQLPSIFEMICVSIIYSVRIISIAYMKGGFMIYDTVRSLNAYHIQINSITTSDRNVYLYWHTYKLPTIPSSRDIHLNRFVYLQYIYHLPNNYRHHIYSSDSPNHKIVTIDQVSCSRFFVNNCSNTSSLYSQIVNSKQDISIINSNIFLIKKN